MRAETITAEAVDRLDYLVAAFHLSAGKRIIEHAGNRGVKRATVDDVEAVFADTTGGNPAPYAANSPHFGSVRKTSVGFGGQAAGPPLQLSDGEITQLRAMLAKIADELKTP